jgi:hypothetical protein
MPKRKPKFTKARQAEFIEQLRRCGNVSEAARLIGVPRPTVYDQRERDEEFASAWTDAIAEAMDGLEAEARRRAVDGYEQEVFYGGKRCGTVRKYSDGLLTFLLRAHRPDLFQEERRAETGADSGVLVVPGETSPDDWGEAVRRHEESKEKSEKE